MKIEIPDELWAKLKKQASEGLPHEDADFTSYDQYGGNMDDAYWGGMDAGECSLANDIVTKAKEIDS